MTSAVAVARTVYIVMCDNVLNDAGDIPFSTVKRLP